MTARTDFFYKECEKIDAALVNAYLELKLDPENPTGIILDSSWGESLLDLESVIKAGETKTYLHLDPAVNPEYLEYDGEDGIPQCIHGDDLSRIISMKYLKDVDQSVRPSDGDVYMFDSQSGLFKVFNLGDFVQNVNNTLANHRQRLVSLEARMTTVENRMTAVENRVTAIEEILRKPEGVPSNVKVTWGNINEYSDSTNTNLKTSGFYTHNPNTEVTNDLRFA